MKRSRFAEEQIIGILKAQEAGVSGAEPCRKYGMRDASFYNGRPGTAAWRFPRPGG